MMYHVSAILPIHTIKDDSPLMIYLFKDFDLSFSNEALCLAGEEACSFRGTHRLELMKHEIDHNVCTLSF